MLKLCSRDGGMCNLDLIKAINDYRQHHTLGRLLRYCLRLTNRAGRDLPLALQRPHGTSW